MRVRAGILLVFVLATIGALAPAAQGGQGEGYFYAKGPVAIPDGHGAAKLGIDSELLNDIDPTLDYVSVSIRVDHAKTRDLVAKLKRPNFDYTGPNPGEPDQRVVTLTNRDTRGENLGSGGCPDQNPMSAPAGFTTLNDGGGPPMPMLPTTPPSLAVGDAPYEGNFQPSEPLAGFNGYHHAPDGNPASPETWKLIVRDVRDNQARGKLRCAVLYLHRI